MSLARALFVSMTFVLLAASVQGATRSNGLAAVVNGKVITWSELEDTITAQRQIMMMQLANEPVRLQQELRELESNALDNLIDRELILEEFKKIGGTIKSQYVDDDIDNLIREQFKGDRNAFVTELAKSGMTMKKFRELREKMIIVQVMRAQKAQRRLPPTPKEVEAYYKKNIDRWREKDMLKISTITIPKFTGEAGSTPETQKQLAEELRTKIAGGADFATTAKTYSQDSRAENGGAWDWMERKLMDKTIADKAFELADGGLSQVVALDAAYIIIYLEAKKLGAAPPIEKVRPEVERMIENESSRDAFEAWLKVLRGKATVRKMSR
ncbi:MAG: peptidylprolyl isomerase [Verrucomicrobiaceae bacterium]|nr:peptidylprolyl isomerase [Verrucomicrobiaceae bacterium]